MIENTRQYKITKKRLSEFRESVMAYDMDEAAARIGSSVLAKAELDALKSEVEVLCNQIFEYDHHLLWEITEDGGDHILIDEAGHINARHAVGYCHGDCPLRMGNGER